MITMDLLTLAIKKNLSLNEEDGFREVNFEFKQLEGSVDFSDQLEFIQNVLYDIGCNFSIGELIDEGVIAYKEDNEGELVFLGSFNVFYDDIHKLYDDIILIEKKIEQNLIERLQKEINPIGKNREEVIDIIESLMDKHNITFGELSNNYKD